MDLSRLLPLALACGALMAPLAASAQSAEPSPPAEETAPQPDAQTPKEEAKSDDGRICRWVKLDMSSRRKTKVCRTVEEWNELNNPR